MYFILLLFLYCPRSGVISRQWWWLLLSLSDFLLTGLRAGQTTVFRSVRTPFWDFSPAVTTRFTDVGQSLTVRRCRGGKRYPQNCKFYENLEYTRTVGACPLRDSYKIRRGVYVPRNIGTVRNQGEDLRDGQWVFPQSAPHGPHSRSLPSHCSQTKFLLSIIGNLRWQWCFTCKLFSKSTSHF